MDIAKQAYYRKPDMIRFLLAENLALKTLLHDKGVLTAEEFQKYQREAMEVLESKVDEQISRWKADHPQEAALMEKLAAVEPQADGLAPGV